MNSNGGPARERLFNETRAIVFKGQSKLPSAGRMLLSGVAGEKLKQLIAESAGGLEHDPKKTD